MTDLRGASDLRAFDRSFAMNNRLRTEGVDHLLSAAREAGVKRLVAQSFAAGHMRGLVVRSSRRTIRSTLTHPKNFDGPWMRFVISRRRSWAPIIWLKSCCDTAPFTARAPDCLTVPWSAGCAAAGFVDRRRRRVVVLPACQRRSQGDGCRCRTQLRGNLNIVDDDPAPVSTWLPALARMLNAKRPFRAPVWLARFMAGDHVVALMTQARAGSNAKAKKEFGWRPLYGSWREGFAEVAARLPS